MLRNSYVLCHYRADIELDRIRGMLRGRARLERKVGLKRLFFLMRTQTRYRVEQQSHWSRAIVRKNIDSAAREHGTSWQYIRNDFAMHNIILLPKMQQILAQYEPLAFRALIELSASHVPPPPPPPTASIPEEAYYLPLRETPADEKHLPSSSVPISISAVSASHPAARVELLNSVERMRRASEPHPKLTVHNSSLESWMQAWKEFDVST